MRVREWYGWHFPELAKVVSDNFQYARVVMLAKDKKNINEEMLEDLKEIVGEPEIADQVSCLLPSRCTLHLLYVFGVLFTCCNEESVLSFTLHPGACLDMQLPG